MIGSMRSPWTIGLLTVAIAARAAAQIGSGQLIPSAPTSLDEIRYRVSTPCLGFHTSSVTVSGGEIHAILTVSGLCATAIGQADIVIGQLPPGQYTLHVTYDSAPAWNFSASFTVSAPAIPTASTMGLVCFATLAATVALCRIRPASATSS
jgi:hypothetical protein